MDLNGTMTLFEWRQVPPLPGLEPIAKEVESKWEDSLMERGIIMKLANGSIINREMPSEGEPLKSI